MSKRTRLFLIVAAAIMVAGLGTGLLAAYKGGFQNLVLIGTDGPAELAYVPKDARMVAYADIRAIMASPLREKLRAAQHHDSQNDFEQRTGINFERDVDHIVASAVDTDASNGPPLVLARGRFDQVRLEGLVREQGGSVEDYKGTRLLSHDGQQDFAVAFVEPDLVAVGSTMAVRRAIDTKEAGSAATVKDNADVMRIVRDIDSGSAWAVARLDSSFSAHLPGNIAQQLPPVNWIAVTGQVDDGLRGTVRAEARDEAAAKDLTEVIRGFMALARLQAGSHKEFDAVIDSLELSGHGNTVTLDFAIPANTFDALAAIRPRPGPPGAAPRRPVPPTPPTPPSSPAL